MGVVCVCGAVCPLSNISTGIDRTAGPIGIKLGVGGF